MAATDTLWRQPDDPTKPKTPNPVPPYGGTTPKTPNPVPPYGGTTPSPAPAGGPVQQTPGGDRDFYMLGGTTPSTITNMMGPGPSSTNMSAPGQYGGAVGGPAPGGSTNMSAPGQYGGVVGGPAPSSTNMRGLDSLGTPGMNMRGLDSTQQQMDFEALLAQFGGQ